VSTALNANFLRPTRDIRMLLLKWLVALLVPLVVFNFVWNGALLVNRVLGNLFSGQGDIGSLIVIVVFIAIFYFTLITLAGYLVAADTGRYGMISVWIDVLIFTVVPILLIQSFGNLIIGLALCAIVWPLYLLLRGLVRKWLHYTPPAPLEDITLLDAEQRVVLMSRARVGSFWFATTFALIWLIVDIIFYVSGGLPFPLLIWGLIRTLLFPLVGYFLGQLSGSVALRRALIRGNGNGTSDGRKGQEKLRRLENLSTARASEEAGNVVPNDLPLRTSGAQRFYLVLIGAFVLFYPFLDPYLFSSGTAGRLDGYGDAGYYVILALGLNIVVGFAGLLDLGYVAFFAIGSYAWGMIGSTQLTADTGIQVIPNIWPWLFWPMLIGAALIAAFWGVVLGAPTLRLRGDYLAIVTLGFGEIIPIFFLELDRYTNGTNGIVGVYPPAFPGVDWSSPVPFYYLIVALIVLTIFVNIRLRDSRLGRAWVAIREDEIAASSSGVNLVNTKLFAFGAGAFFSGIAGAYHSAKLGIVSPDNFNFSDSIIYLAMVVIGGIGSIPGVIVGALAVYSINLFILNQLDTLASDPTSFMFGFKEWIVQFIPGFTFGNVRNLIFGVILVIIMIFRPEGLIPSARRRRELHRAPDEAVEIGSLDVPPGAPGFESEVRVE
jgi:ABC-type branched-subunit amino acid transport system permease subunit